MPVTSPASAPVKSAAESADTAIAAVVAVAALPSRSPVIVPAAKLPFTSRSTSADGVFRMAAAFTAEMPEAMPAAGIPPT